MRMTTTTTMVLKFITNSDVPVYGRQICLKLELCPGTVYPILKRLSEARVVAWEWEEGEVVDRPRRKLYRVVESS